MGDKYLSDVIDYERDMKKHNFIAIYSGVGSGKNRFIDSFYKEDPEIPNPQMTVLLITSRRAKVNEILSDQKKDTDVILDENDVKTYIQGKVGHWGNLHEVRNESESVEEFKRKYKKHLRVINDGYDTHYVYQQSVVCTNAFIEKYIQYVYDPQDVTTHLWELFDMIVVDEVHSLILDASYQSAPFYVYDLIREYLLRCELAEDNFYLMPKCKHMVLMTGTPEHLKELSVLWKYNVHVLDRREECKNVFPRNIYFMDKKNVAMHLTSNLEMGNRSICFNQSIRKLKSYYDKIEIDDKSVIAFSFSKEEEKDKLSEKELKIMEDTEDNIKKYGKLPENIKLLLSTERNKEGINIYDNIVNLYVDSKHLGDIVQMAGRVRLGVENMYVIVDGGIRKKDVLDSYDAMFSFRKLVGDQGKAKVLNDYWKEICTENGSDLYDNRNSTTKASESYWSSEFISFVHEKFPFIRYSYFKNNFEFYLNAYNGQWDYNYAEENWENALEKGNIKKRFEKVFPYSKVYPYIPNKKENNKVDPVLIEKAKSYISENMVLGEKYSANERDQFINDLNKILNKDYERIDLIFRFMKVKYQMKALTKTGKDRKNAIKDHDRDKKLLVFSEKNS